MNKRAFTTLVLATGIAFGLFAQMTSGDAVAQMRRGINMGNTLEPPFEGDWNNPPAQESYFDLYRDAGFDVVRVPVRWHYHTSDTAPFEVEETWMNRVEEVVDWGLSRGLFIVINAHHEEWIKADYNNPVYRARFDSIWSQIAIRFKDKSEKLIFEIINEPKGLTQDQNNELHQRILNIIRRTNPTRNVIIQGHEWGGAEQLITMAIPEDPYLIGSFHSYDPWPFGLEGTGTFGSSFQLQELEKKFIVVKEWSDSAGVPVFLGEFACHSSADYNSRMKHYRAYINFSLKYGFTPCAWDDGGNFRALLRASGSWNEVKDILIFCDPGSPTITRLSMEQDTVVAIQWNNGTGGQESLLVQRKTGSGKFTTIATLAADSNSYRDGNTVQDEDHYYRIVAQHPEQKITHSNPLLIHVPGFVPKVRGYFLGVPHAVPGTIEAEDYDTGGEGLTYHDMDSRNIAGAYRTGEAVDIYTVGSSAYHIGNALPGEWIEYSLYVDRPGEFLVDISCAAQTRGGRFQVNIGNLASDTMEVNASVSWLVTAKTSFQMDLPEGEQIMRFTIIGPPLFNIDKFSFSLNTTGIQADHSLPSGLVLFQDPTGELVIRTSQCSVLTCVQVFELSGSLVASSTSPATIHRIPGHQLRAGIYLVRALDTSQVYKKKILIQ